MSDISVDFDGKCLKFSSLDSRRIQGEDTGGGGGGGPGGLEGMRALSRIKE